MKNLNMMKVFKNGMEKIKLILSPKQLIGIDDNTCDGSNIDHVDDI